jgi:hypothetical protein
VVAAELTLAAFCVATGIDFDALQQSNARRMGDLQNPIYQHSQPAQKGVG